MKNKLNIIKNIPVLLVLTTWFLAGCGPTKDEYRKDFVKGCVNKYAKNKAAASVEGRKLVEEYCNCIGDKLNEQMNAEQWRTLNKSNDTLLSGFQNIIQPCKENFKPILEADTSNP